MTKEEYIGKLRSKLRFSLSAGEIRDIAGDISEVFADGIAEGRSEGEICTSLGSPVDAARNILTEHGISPNTGRTFAKAVISAVIMGGGFVSAVEKPVRWNFCGGFFADSAPAYY